MGSLFDEMIFSEGCTCPRCQRKERILSRNPDFQDFNAHKHDYLHAEDESVWTFELYCKCELCSAERARLRDRSY